MHGNVMEWCQDRLGRYVPSITDDEAGSGPEKVLRVVNPQGALHAVNRINRGGGWYNGMQNLRSDYRNSGPPLAEHYNLGFRVVKSAREVKSSSDVK
jgi:formylglycine-generating enzyme required for sulfatase activity